MSQRARKRVKLVLPLRFWGMEASGKPFSGLAHTLDVTREGARLGGVRVELNVGDIIGVQYRHSKGRFRVTWVGEPNSRFANQVGLEVVEKGRDFWAVEGVDLNARDEEYKAPAKRQPAAAPVAKPLGRMYEVEGAVEVLEANGKSAYWAEITQIGERGAFVKAYTPQAAGSKVQLRISIASHDFSIKAQVRTSQASSGMTVEFTQPSTNNDAVRLKSLIYGLESGVVRFDAPLPEQTTGTFGERVGAISDELRRLHSSISGADIDELSRQEFQEAIAHLRQAGAFVEQSLDGVEEVEAALRTARLQSAVRLCKSVGEQIRQGGMRDNPEDVRELVETVEDLFTLLTGLNFTMTEEAGAAEALPMAAAAAAGTGDDAVVPLDDVAVAAHLAHFHEHRARKKRKS